MFTKSNLILVLGILVVIAPELQMLGSAERAMEWGELWRLINLGAGAALVRLSGQHREREKNGS